MDKALGLRIPRIAKVFYATTILSNIYILQEGFDQVHLRNVDVVNNAPNDDNIIRDSVAGLALRAQIFGDFCLEKGYQFP